MTPPVPPAQNVFPPGYHCEECGTVSPCALHSGMTKPVPPASAEASQLTEDLLRALLDDISGPLVDEKVEHIDIIGPMLLRPDVRAFIADYLAKALRAQERP